MLPNSSALSSRMDANGEGKIICLLSSGSFTHRENGLARELEACLEESAAQHLLLDFANVAWITSNELGTLILLHKSLRARGGRLTLFNLREEIYEVFAVTRLHTLLNVRRMS